MADEKTTKLFDAYETAALVVPGASVLLGIALVSPEMIPKAAATEVSLGALGLFAIASFCAGHIIQAPANAIEELGWRRWGRPTERMRNQGCGLADAQIARIPARLSEALSMDIEPGADAKQWRAVTAQIATYLSASGRSARLDKFNSNYGLFRGLTVALAIVTIVAVLKHEWINAGGAMVFCWASRYRMKRFSGHYARELWLSFLVPETDSAK